ncbi:MAG TPA: Gfo/Idh/MocA family oxidoreductase [Planctomycetaceae bacterium]|jgi:predicted dehydrogenase|nr:Gfo/Idh/MocA family oxidoreductase [Planctomycetaceae bacterium]
MSRLRVGVVGAGALGRHHARIYSQLPSTELMAVADTSAERGRAVADACGTHWFEDYHRLFDFVDAVSIAVPTVGHHSVALEFLDRGVACLVEKPLATTVAQAAEIVAAADRRTATLQVGHVERFNPAFQEARRLVRNPKYLRCERFSPYAFRSTDIGVVLDMMIHDIDLVLDLTNSPLESVEAFGISILGEHEDCAQARLIFANGCIADLTANRVSPTTRRTMQIWSEAGCVNIDFASREVIRHAPNERLLAGDSVLARAKQVGAEIDRLKGEIFTEYVRVDRPAVSAADALTAELSSFAECVKSQQRPLVDGQAALAAMEAADHVLRSMAAHRWNGAAIGPVGPFVLPFMANPVAPQSVRSAA